MFSDGVSLPSLTLKYLFHTKSDDSYFNARFSKRHEKAYFEMRQNLVRGPSIVFSRFHEAGETFLRKADPSCAPHELCETILGYDAKTLYLKCIGEMMPCSHPGFRDASNNFAKRCEANKKARGKVDTINRRPRD